MQIPITFEIKAIGAIGIALLVALALGAHPLTTLNVWQWFLFASLLWGYVWWQLWRRRDLNRASLQDPHYPSLGIANRLSVLRGGLIAMTGGFLCQPPTDGITAWIPGLLYCVAAILDRIDGFVARRSKHISLLGSELDTTYDALGLLVAPLLAFYYGKVHWSFLLVSAAYYCFCWGLHWRKIHGQPIYPLIPNQLRRTLAGFQMGFVAFILLPCFHPSITISIAFIFMLPLLIGFVVDWFVVSGRIETSIKTHRIFQALAAINATFIQPFIRVLLCFILLAAINTIPFSYISLAIIALAVALIAFGFAGRVGAIVLLILISLMNSNVTPILLIASICSISIMLFGTGRFSLWKGDESWINRRDGEETQS